MNNNRILSLDRFSKVIRNEFALNTRSLFITVGAIAGLLLLINIASVRTSNTWDFHVIWYPLVLMIGGHVITSLSFKEMHDREKGYTYITLPASQIEKYLSKLIITSIGYVVISLAGYFLFSLLSTGVTELFFGMSHGLFIPFNPIVWQFIGLYIATHAVTFFGAVFFKKLHLLNTILWLTIIGIGLGFIALGIAKLVFWGWFPGFAIEINDDMIKFATGAQRMELQNFFDNLLATVKVLFYFIFPAFFWTTGYFRLRETEV